MAKQQLVLAFFENEAAADSAVNALKSWDKASKEVKLGAIGVLAKDAKGKVKTHKLGSRHTPLGVALGAIAGVLTGGITLIGGAIVGGIIGAFVHKGLGLSKEDLARIGGELDGGKAAVGVMASDAEVSAVTAKLAELGGKPETHEVSDAAVEQATSAAEAAPAGEAPVEAPEAPAAEAPAAPMSPSK